MILTTMVKEVSKATICNCDFLTNFANEDNALFDVKGSLKYWKENTDDLKDWIIVHTNILYELLKEAEALECSFLYLRGNNVDSHSND